MNEGQRIPLEEIGVPRERIDGLVEDAKNRVEGGEISIPPFPKGPLTEGNSPLPEGLEERFDKAIKGIDKVLKEKIPKKVLSTGQEIVSDFERER